MKETRSVLAGLGLTETEADLYVAGLGRESISVQELHRQTDTKRPTIYHAIGTLMDKGLVAEQRVGNKIRFSMSPPAHMRTLVARQREMLDAREKKLDELIPLLSQQMDRAASADEISAVRYVGIEGVKMVLDIAFYCRSKHWDIIAPIKNFLREYDKEYAERYLRARKHYGITSRSLWERTEKSRTLSAEEIRNRNPRYVPKNMEGKFKSMMILFDDKVAIISSFRSPSAILITSKELHELFATMFAGIWGSSEPYAKAYKNVARSSRI